MDRIWYPIIEVDQNAPHLFDVVTKDHAEDMTVGDRVILVTSDHVGEPSIYLDWGWATWGRVTSIEPTKNDPNLYVVRAEYDDES